MPGFPDDSSQAPKMVAETVTFRKHDRPDWVGAFHWANRRARGVAKAPWAAGS